MKTYSAKPTEVVKKWWIVDATDMIVGRLASSVASILRGKHKPMYTPHIDCGDNVIIINADKTALTGKKLEKKIYFKHTGYPGGIKQKIARDEKPEIVVHKAVERMISRNPLGTDQLRKLYVYAGSAHPHQAQNPEALDLASRNPKNKKRN